VLDILAAEDLVQDQEGVALTIQPKAQRFLKKLKKKNPDAASEVVMDIFELKNDPKTSM